MTAAPLLELVSAPLPALVPDGRIPPAGVRRPRLVSPLLRPEAPRLTVLVAPAGFGKTTLLSEWAARDPRPFAWVTASAEHNNPRRLLRSFAQAIDAASAGAPDSRIVLVLDDVHVLRSAAAHEAVAWIATQLPADVSVALASRSEPPVPVARLRAEGRVNEIRMDELAMSRSEAGALLRGAGLGLDREDIDTLLHVTEGWPAALSLSLRVLAGQRVPGSAVARFGGTDRLIAEYLREEVLAGLSPQQLDFTRRTAILEMVDAAVCDRVLERSDSAAVIAGLARSGFPLVALDRTGDRYRCHRLLDELLRAELHRTEPDLESRLHRRASAWYAGAGDRARALAHALAADELGRAGDLVWEGVPQSIEQGSCVAVEHWLSQFDDAQLAAHPRLALTAAGMHLTQGRGDLAAHWLAAAVAGRPDRGLAGAAAALSAALSPEGLTRMAQDARRSAELLDPESPCQALAGLLLGITEHLGGEAETARRRIEHSGRRAAVPAPHVHALCLAQLALIAIDAGDREEAARLSVRARAQIARHGLARYPTSALALAVSALVGAQRGRLEDARADATTAAGLLDELVDLPPWYEAEVRITIARAALRLSELNDARTELARAARLAARVPEAVALAAWLAATEADVEAFAASANRLPQSLTTAELKILRFLPTHLSFREIAERTFVSANTVKTQANAVYRKLDVCSRSEAVARARGLGLV